MYQTTGILVTYKYIILQTTSTTTNLKHMSNHEPWFELKPSNKPYTHIFTGVQIHSLF